MVICIKTVSFAWNVADGYRKDEELNPDQLSRRIPGLPNILDYYVYIYFFLGPLVGPTFDYQELMDFIYKRNRYAKIPSTLAPSLKTALLAAIFMASTATLLPKYNASYIRTEDFEKHSFLFRLFYSNFTITFIKFRYYAGWMLSQLAVDASGFSYNGVNKQGEHQWNAIRTVEPGLELVNDLKKKVDVSTFFTIFILSSL